MPDEGSKVPVDTALCTLGSLFGCCVLFLFPIHSLVYIRLVFSFALCAVSLFVSGFSFSSVFLVSQCVVLSFILKVLVCVSVSLCYDGCFSSK